MYIFFFKWIKICNNKTNKKDITKKEQKRKKVAKKKSNEKEIQ